MKKEEKNELLRQLNERQLQLSAIMCKSDAHASKCVKLGLNFAETYPDDYACYVSAREEYNINEEKIAEVEAEEVEEETNPAILVV